MNPHGGENQLRVENHIPRRPDGIERAADVIGDRWTILVLREAFYGVRRYGEMVRNLGIARNVLAARLKALVADGLLERRRYRTDPDWYEYVLTDAGRDHTGRSSRCCAGQTSTCRPPGSRSCACVTDPAGTGPTPRSSAPRVARSSTHARSMCSDIGWSSAA
jgi:DNA-binding HxlR family transcriptional regulator